MSPLGSLTQQKVTVFIISQSGSIENTYRFEIEERKENIKLVKSDDNSILLVKLDYYVTPHNIVFSKYSLDGTKIWDREIENEIVDNIVKLISTSDGGFLMCGWVSNASQYLLKIDQNGNKQWELTTEDMFTEHLTDFAIECNDAGYLVTGFNYEERNNLILTKLNQSGNISWRKQIDGNFSFSGSAVMLDTDGYMIAGSTVIDEENYIHDHTLIKTDNLGNVIWSKSYHDYFTGFDLSLRYAREFSLDLCQASDGGIVVIGAVDFYNHGFLMKTDLSGEVSDSVIVYNFE